MATSLLENNKLTFTTNGSTIASRFTATADTLTFVGDSSANVTLTGVATPTSNTDAVNKSYVDNLVNGLKWKEPVTAATTGAGNLATDFEDGDTLDGVTLATGDRILIKNQANGIENGIYIVAASGAPARSSDMPAGDAAHSDAVLVMEGSTNADIGFVCTNDEGSDVVGTDALNFIEFASSIVPPGGSDTQVQFNNSGSFGGVSGWTTNGSTNLNGGDNSNLILGASGDITMTHNGTNSLITSTTGNFIIDNTNASGATVGILGSDDANTSFQVQNNSAAVKFQVAGSGQVDIPGNLDVTGGIDIDADSVPLTIGASADISISHDGTNSTLTSTTGDFTIDNTNATGSTIAVLGTDNANTDFQIQNNSAAAKFTVDGSGQVDIPGNLDVTGGIDIDADSVALTIGASADISISHNGTNSTLTTTTGDFTIDNTNASGSTIAMLGSDNANSTFEIQNDSAAVKFTVDGSGQVDIANNLDVTGGIDIDADNVALTIGAGADVSISHDGTDSTLTSTTGNFTIDNTNATGSTIVQLGTDDSNTNFQVKDNSGVTIMQVRGDDLVNIPDNGTLGFGTGVDLLISHNGTASSILNTSGSFSISSTAGAGSDIVIDNQSTNKAIINRLGTDTDATSFQVQNNSGAAKLTIDGTGAASFASTVDVAGNLDATGGIDIDADNVALTIGAGADISMSHDGTDSTLTSATGNFTIDNTNASGSTIVLLGSDTSATNLQVQNNSATASLIVDGSGLVNLPAPNRSATPSASGSTLKLDSTTFTDNNTAGSGTATQHAFNAIARPTLAASNLNVTTTTAATLYIENAPAAGSNQTITNSYALWAPAGNVLFGGDTFSNAYHSTSDATLKTNINKLENPLSTINKINGYSYNWKNEEASQEEQWGVIAQQLEEAGLEHLVSSNGNNKTVNYMGLIPLLIESIKELSNKIN